MQAKKARAISITSPTVASNKSSNVASPSSVPQAEGEPNKATKPASLESHTEEMQSSSTGLFEPDGNPSLPVKNKISGPPSSEKEPEINRGFATGDLVFAKFNMDPWWPAQVKRVQGAGTTRPRRAKVHFFGENSFDELPFSKLRPFVAFFPRRKQPSKIPSAEQRKQYQEGIKQGLRALMKQMRKRKRRKEQGEEVAEEVLDTRTLCQRLDLPKERLCFLVGEKSNKLSILEEDETDDDSKKNDDIGTS